MNRLIGSCAVGAALSLAVAGLAAGGDTRAGFAVGQATNPCSAKNPCAAQGPGVAGHVDPRLVTRPAGSVLLTAKQADLVGLGERLWKDPRLGANGLTCQTCHQGNANFNTMFASPYPHRVAMAKERANLDTVRLDEMVQLCLVIPMAGKPLPWNSRELAALTAYAGEVQKSFKPTAGAANPCAAKNPCAATNPCAVKKK